jgi:hypothetical protein
LFAAMRGLGVVAGRNFASEYRRAENGLRAPGAIGPAAQEVLRPRAEVVQ